MTRTTVRSRAPLLLAAAMLASGVVLATDAAAQAPALIPIQGVLHTADGLPVDAAVTATFSLYDAADAAEPLWSETQALDVADGLVTAWLGTNVPLPLELFADTGELWVGIGLGDDSEMPRFQIATAPYAAWAEAAGDAATLDGYTPDDLVAIALDEATALFSPRDHTTAWDELLALPAGFADGIDDDRLSTLACAVGQTLKWSTDGWTCGVDLDTDTNTDLLASITTCTPGQTLKWSGAAWTCGTDVDTDTDTDTDTRCDATGACAQVCIGTSCRTGWPGIPHSAPLSGTFSGTYSWAVPALAVGRVTELVVAVTTYGGSNCAGRVSASWRADGGVTLRGASVVSGTNVNSGGDGGSGMSDTELLTLPVFDGTVAIDFAASGCHNYVGELIGYNWVE